MASREDTLSEAMEKQLRISFSKHGNLFREDVRLKTFANWKVDFIDKHELAMLGFYYQGPEDLVRCVFCHSSLGSWEPWDKVFIGHFIFKADCPLLTYSAYENDPIDPERLDHALLSASYYTCEGCEKTVLCIDRYDRKWEVHTPSNLFSSIGFDIPGLMHPRYNTVKLRHRTFQFCGWKSKKDPLELTEPGFFYTKISDKVTCFCCGVSVSGWRVDDCPWEVHAYACNTCEYVKTVKGQRLIDHARRKFANMVYDMDQRITLPLSTFSSPATLHKSTNITTTAGQSSSSTRSELPNRICTICLDKEYNMVFVPCGHVVTCEDCAKSVSTCPVCRESITSRTKIYLG